MADRSEKREGFERGGCLENIGKTLSERIEDKIMLQDVERVRSKVSIYTQATRLATNKDQELSGNSQPSDSFI